MGLGEIIGGVVSGIAGPIQSHRSQEKLNREEQGFQRELARNSLGWKIEDAREHGISAMAAMGGSGHYGSGTAGTTPVDSGSIQRAGQNIGRAIDSTLTKKDRDTILAENLRGKKLANDLLFEELGRRRANNPPRPDSSGTPRLTGGQVIQGQGDSYETGKGYIVEQPVIRPRSDPGDPSKEAGTVQDWTYVKHRDGSMSMVPSERMQQTIEEDIVQKSQWWLRNKIKPLGQRVQIDEKTYPPPKGKKWVWTGFSMKAVPITETKKRKYKRYERKLKNFYLPHRWGQSDRPGYTGSWKKGD